MSDTEEKEEIAAVAGGENTWLARYLKEHPEDVPLKGQRPLSKVRVSDTGGPSGSGSGSGSARVMTDDEAAIAGVYEGDDREMEGTQNQGPSNVASGSGGGGMIQEDETSPFQIHSSTGTTSWMATGSFPPEIGIPPPTPEVTPPNLTKVPGFAPIQFKSPAEGLAPSMALPLQPSNDTFTNLPTTRDDKEATTTGNPNQSAIETTPVRRQGQESAPPQTRSSPGNHVPSVATPAFTSKPPKTFPDSKEQAVIHPSTTQYSQDTTSKESPFHMTTSIESNLRKGQGTSTLPDPAATAQPSIPQDPSTVLSPPQTKVSSIPPSTTSDLPDGRKETVSHMNVHIKGWDRRSVRWTKSVAIPEDVHINVDLVVKPVKLDISYTGPSKKPAAVKQLRYETSLRILSESDLKIDSLWVAQKATGFDVEIKDPIMMIAGEGFSADRRYNVEATYHEGKHIVWFKITADPFFWNGFPDPAWTTIVDDLTFGQSRIPIALDTAIRIELSPGFSSKLPLVSFLPGRSSLTLFTANRIDDVRQDWSKNESTTVHIVKFEDESVEHTLSEVKQNGRVALVQKIDLDDNSVNALSRVTSTPRKEWRSEPFVLSSTAYASTAYDEFTSPPLEYKGSMKLDSDGFLGEWRTKSWSWEKYRAARGSPAMESLLCVLDEIPVNDLDWMLRWTMQEAKQSLWESRKLDRASNHSGLSKVDDVLTIIDEIDQSKNGSLLARQEKTMNEEWFRLFAGQAFGEEFLEQLLAATQISNPSGHKCVSLSSIFATNVLARIGFADTYWIASADTQAENQESMGSETEADSRKSRGESIVLIPSKAYAFLETLDPNILKLPHLNGWDNTTIGFCADFVVDEQSQLATGGSVGEESIKIRCAILTRYVCDLAQEISKRTGLLVGWQYCSNSGEVQMAKVSRFDSMKSFLALDILNPSGKVQTRNKRSKAKRRQGATPPPPQAQGVSAVSSPVGAGQQGNNAIGSTSQSGGSAQMMTAAATNVVQPVVSPWKRYSTSIEVVITGMGRDKSPLVVGLTHDCEYQSNKEIKTTLSSEADTYIENVDFSWISFAEYYDTRRSQPIHKISLEDSYKMSNFKTTLDKSQERQRQTGAKLVGGASPTGELNYLYTWTKHDGTSVEIPCGYYLHRMANRSRGHSYLVKSTAGIPLAGETPRWMTIVEDGAALGGSAPVPLPMELAVCAKFVTKIHASTLGLPIQTALYIVSGMHIPDLYDENAPAENEIRVEQPVTHVREKRLLRYEDAVVTSTGAMSCTISGDVNLKFFGMGEKMKLEPKHFKTAPVVPQLVAAEKEGALGLLNGMMDKILRMRNPEHC